MTAVRKFGILAAGPLLATLALATPALAQEPDISCGEATAVAANARADLDAGNGALTNLRSALDIALGANTDAGDNTAEQDQAITDAQAALDVGVGTVEDLTATLDAALAVKTDACAPTTTEPVPEPTDTVPAPDHDTEDQAPDEGVDRSGGQGTDVGDLGSFAGSDGFDQTDPDEVPIGYADTGGR